MTGTIKKMIDTIVEKRSKGSAMIAELTRTKLLLKGIDPNKYSSSSSDDPIIIDKLKSVAKEFNISI